MKSLLLSILYFIISALYILSAYHFSVAPQLLLKSLIIPVLIIIFILNVRVTENRFHLFILAGLVFSWAGDVILQLDSNGTDLFVLGLLAFLLAHIMYIIAFLGTPGNNGFLEKHFYLTFALLLYGVAFTGLLWDYLGKLRIPVIFYGLVILTMLAAAINRYYKSEKTSYYMVLAGAILFVVSDSLLAINKFSFSFASSAITVMASYVLAQFLIITGYLVQERKSLR